MEAEDNVVYYCHNCEASIDEIIEIEDGVLTCTICNEPYIEIVESELEEEQVNNEHEEKKENNGNSIQYFNNGNAVIAYFDQNRSSSTFNDLFGGFNRINNNNNILGDYAFGDISNLISTLGLNQNRGP
eukprot:859712_1